MVRFKKLKQKKKRTKTIIKECLENVLFYFYKFQALSEFSHISINLCVCVCVIFHVTFFDCQIFFTDLFIHYFSNENKTINLKKGDE